MHAGHLKSITMDQENNENKYTSIQLIISIVVVLFSLKHCIYDPLTEPSRDSGFDMGRCMEHYSESRCLEMLEQ
jgi:hypothetical protein